MMRPPATRWLVLSMTVALLLPACSDTADDADTGIAATAARSSAVEAYDAVIDPAAMEAARELVDRLGSDAAFAATVRALERGYTTEQVIAGAASIEPDGAIPNTDPVDVANDIFAWPVDAGDGTQILAAGVFAVGESATLDAFHEAMRRKFEPTDFLTDQPTTEEMILAEPELTELFIGSIIALVDVGYSLEQIVEGIVFGDLRWAIGRTDSVDRDRYLCSVLASEAGELITPKQSAPGFVRDSRECREAIDERTMGMFIDGEWVDTETTAEPTGNGSSTTADVDEDETIDGTYIGSASVAGEHSENATVLDSQITVLIADGIANVEIDMTTEIVWVRFDDDTEPCISTDHWILSGSGTASSPLSIELSADSLDLIAISGCERDEEDEDDAFDTLPLEATIADGTINGSFFNGLFHIAAERT